ncbi:MAG TPA: GNAT family protein [Thermoanaerobaculia bacterium]|nr:GNAT family protein [Thermoanaerobaculia bacterium]
MLRITTKRLLLRPLAEGDAARLAAYRSHEEVARYQSWSTFTLDDALALVHHDGPWTQIAIALRATGEIIGDIGVCAAPDGSAEIGFTLAPEHQGRGYAGEAVRAVVERFPRVVAVVDARNAPAIALVTRLGFRLQKTERTEFKGGVCDEHHFVLLR